MDSQYSGEQIVDRGRQAARERLAVIAEAASRAMKTLTDVYGPGILPADKPAGGDDWPSTGEGVIEAEASLATPGYGSLDTAAAAIDVAEARKRTDAAYNLGRLSDGRQPGEDYDKKAA